MNQENERLRDRLKQIESQVCVSVSLLLQDLFLEMLCKI